MLKSDLDQDELIQGKLIENYNKLADAFEDAGVVLKKYDKNGVCQGLTANYLMFVQEGRDQEESIDEVSKQDEFHSYLAYLGSLTTEKIQNLVGKYRQSGKDFSIASPFGRIQFKRLLDFLKVVSDAQQYQLASIIRANRDREYTIFCDVSTLATELKNARLKDEKLMRVSTGKHAFAMQKAKEGFYVFDPNHIKRRLLHSEDEVAKEIIQNLDGFFPLPSPDETGGSDLSENASNSKVALNISFLSYGDENRELDDLIADYKNAIDTFEQSQSVPVLTPFIAEYREGKLSRADLALILHDTLSQHDALTEALVKFDKALLDYLGSKGIKTEQEALEMRLTTDTDFIKSDAFVHHINTLNMAAKSNRILLVKSLLEKGADPNRADSDGVTPLFITAQDGYTHSSALLLKQGAKPDQANDEDITPLCMAALNGHTEVVTLLIKHGADLNRADLYHGKTALSHAAYNGHAEVVKILLEHGAHLDQATDNGLTPLCIAAQEGHTEVVTMLLEKGADIGHATNNGLTPLLLAAQKGQTEVVKKLLERGAKPNQATKNGITPLYLAAQNGHADVVSTLLEANANANIPRERSVDVLLEHANKTGCLKSFKTLLLGWDETSFLSRFIYNKPVMPKKLEGFTPLHAAVFYGHLNVATMLLDNGADINQKARGITPLDFARAMNNQDMIKLIESRKMAGTQPRKQH